MLLCGTVGVAALVADVGAVNMANHLAEVPVYYTVGASDFLIAAAMRDASQFPGNGRGHKRIPSAAAQFNRDIVAKQCAKVRQMCKNCGNLRNQAVFGVLTSSASLWYVSTIFSLASFAHLDARQNTRTLAGTLSAGGWRAGFAQAVGVD